MDLDCPGIYKIVNTRNNKFYIGSSKNLKTRKYEHFRLLKNNKHFNRFLQSAYNIDNHYFEFHVIEYVDNLDIIFKREQYYLDIFQCYKDKIGYNLTEKVEGTFNAPRCRKEAIEKLIKTGGFKPFSVFDKNLNLIGSWTNQRQCLRDLNIPNSQGKMICAALKWRQHTIAGYYFIYNYELHRIMEKVESSFLKPTPTFQVFKDNVPVGRTYKNQRICAEELGIDFKKISLCLKGKRKSHAGYTFKFVD